MVMLAMLVAFIYRANAIPIAWILVSGIALRAICLAGEPLFEDDFYRYLWDGWQTATTYDPFSTVPAAYFGVELDSTWESVLSRINYPDVATVYGPVLQWIFALGYWIAPGQIWPLQLLAATTDIALLWLLSKMFSGSSSRVALLFYAWCPLLLKEFALTAHPDIFAIALVVLALRLGSARWLFTAGVLMGFAIGIKIFALLALPFLVPAERQFRSLLVDYGRFLAGCIVVVTAITTSFGSLWIWLPGGLTAMAKSWLFNAPLHLLMMPLTGFPVAKALLLSGFLIAACLLWHRHQKLTIHRRYQSLAMLYGLFLLALPAFNPWYAIWFLPFAVSTPWRWPWVAGVALMLAYWTGVNVGVTGDGLYRLPSSVLLVEFGLIGIAVIVDAVSSGRAKADTAC